MKPNNIGVWYSDTGYAALIWREEIIEAENGSR